MKVFEVIIVILILCWILGFLLKIVIPFLTFLVVVCLAIYLLFRAMKNFLK